MKSSNQAGESVINQNSGLKRLVVAAIGIAMALSLTGLMSNLLFGITPSDPLTIAAVAILLLFLALLSSYLPARRATRADPLAALRYQ